jgi:vacuolar-type H+-ATPase subunit F/Vma7
MEEDFEILDMDVRDKDIKIIVFQKSIITGLRERVDELESENIELKKLLAIHDNRFYSKEDETSNINSNYIGNYFF